MSQRSNGTYRPPDVDATEMLERKRLEAELFSLDGQVRRFDRIRERLVAVGKDPAEVHREFQARREELVAELKQPRSVSVPPNVVDSQLPLVRPGVPLLTRPIAPASFDSMLGIFGIGSSGVVQVAPASDNTNIVPQGPFPHTGKIYTIPGSYPGDVTFSGDLAVGPDKIPPDQYDPTINYFWLRNWKYLIPFPPPTVFSRFTYRFDVYANVGVFSGSEANVMCFVSLGETPNLTTGTDVTVDIDGGWPLLADLSQPGPTYNGYYGSFGGQVTVQRSFMVRGGHVPGVAVIVGVIGALAMMTEVRLLFPSIGYSGISISSENVVGRVAYSYEPQLVAKQ